MTAPRTLDAELLLDARGDLGEGPIWHEDRQLVSWVEVYDGQVNWLSLDGTARDHVYLGGWLGVAVPAANGALALATGDGFKLLESDGSLRMLAEVEADRNSFLNDGKCDAAGRFWAGTLGVGADGLADPGAGSLYCLEPDGRLRTVLGGISLSNGMDWSPDGKTFYYIDSLTGWIDAYEFDVSAGELGAKRRAVEIPKEDGFADGMCVDTDGCIWAAIWGVGEVRRYTPDGALDTVVRLPITDATSCTFAGPDLDVLVITSATRHLDDEARAAQPHAGSVFACRPGQTGSLPHRFGG